MLRKARQLDIPILKSNFESIYELESHKYLYPKGHSKYYEMPSKNPNELIYVSENNGCIIGYFYAYIENNEATDIVTINFSDKPQHIFAIDMYKFIKLLIQTVEKATFYSLESSQGYFLDKRIIKKLNGTILPNKEAIELRDGTIYNLIKYEVYKDRIKEKKWK